jgi:ParB-like nuclease family protein
VIQKTKDYEIFKFREDNRDKIVKAHVKRLVESISSRDLLEMRPILVNGNMEIIDGQHRLLAAKELNLFIYYKIDENLINEDVILMNIAKAWGIGDYMNYYCKNSFDEYLKLKTFTKKNNLQLKVAINMTMGESKDFFMDFKHGKYIFNNANSTENLELCWDTIEYIKRMNGYSPYLTSARFWKALLKLIISCNFDYKKWKSNLEKMIERFGARATSDDYMRMMMEIYNWKNNNKINLLEH